MFKKIKQLSVTLAAALLLGAPVLAPVSVYAAEPDGATVNDSLCNGIQVADGKDVAADAVGTAATCQDDSSDGTSLNSVIRLVINMFSLIVGAVSVIMIIYAGFKYITSGGNDSNVGAAKNTILYAVIGLVIVALAQIIVKFVLTKAADI